MMLLSLYATLRPFKRTNLEILCPVGVKIASDVYIIIRYAYYRPSVLYAQVVSSKTATTGQTTCKGINATFRLAFFRCEKCEFTWYLYLPEMT